MNKEEYSHDYYLKNKDKISEYKKQWYKDKNNLNDELLNQELKRIHNEIEENRLSDLSQKLFNQLNYEYKNQIIELMGEMIIFQNKINRIIKELKEEGKPQEIPLFEGTMEQLDNLTILKEEGKNNE